MGGAGFHVSVMRRPEAGTCVQFISFAAIFGQKQGPAGSPGGRTFCKDRYSAMAATDFMPPTPPAAPSGRRDRSVAGHGRPAL
jgi:hypothetical protein